MKDKVKAPKTSFKSIAMLLQGGGALGAYQAGVYQALFEANLEPDWVAGISIGAINAAIIAGNAPNERLAALRAFWNGVTMDDFQFSPPVFKYMMTRNAEEHQALNLFSAMRAMFLGIPGFFTLRMPIPWLEPQGSLAAISFCDTSPLHATLQKLIDFDRLNNDKSIRLSIGAVNVTSGNFTTFDNKEMTITTDHIMASGALPPGFPPVEIDGEYYWDGGLVSNTPMQWLLKNRLQQDTLVFQIDLWSADGEFPQNMAEVFTRQKDIQYSSRTRANTDRFKERHKLRHALATLMDKMPENLKQLPEAKLLAQQIDNNAYNIVHLIYHNKDYEGYSKDVEFSRLSMEAHWQSGYEDTLHTLSHPEVLQLPHNKEAIGIYDFSSNRLQKYKKMAV